MFERERERGREKDHAVVVIPINFNQYEIHFLCKFYMPKNS